MDSVQKSSEIRNFCTEFLLFAYLAKIKHFYNTKLPAFVFFADIGVLNTNLKYPTANHFGLDADFYCRGKLTNFKNLFDKSKKLIDSVRSNMAEVFQEVMLQECGNFTWLTKIEKMKLSNRELDN